MVQILLRYKKIVVVTLLFGLLFGTIFGFGLQNSLAANGTNSRTQSSASGCYVAVCTGGWKPAHEDGACYTVNIHCL